MFIDIQGVVRIYDIPDNTFESSGDEDEEEEDEEGDKGIRCINSILTVGALSKEDDEQYEFAFTGFFLMMMQKPLALRGFATPCSSRF